MKNLFPILVTFLVMINSPYAKAQNSFLFRHISEQDETPSGIIETSDGGFIISAGAHINEGPGNAILYRLRSNGDTICSRTVVNSGGTCSLTSLIKLDNGYFTGVGFKTSSAGIYYLWLLTFTDSLVIIHDTAFQTNYSYSIDSHIILDHFRNLIVYGCNGESLYQFNIYIYQFSQNTDLLSYHFYDNPTMNFPFSMTEKPDHSGYYMMIFGHYLINTNSASQILSFDYLFNVTHIDSIPRDLAMYFSSKNINNNEFILTGKRTYQTQTIRTDKLGILKVDTDLRVIKENYIGPEDTISYPGYLLNMDFLNVNNIYYTGVANQCIYGHFPSSPSYILLGRFDSSLNLTGEKYYGGDMYYEVSCMAATTDGGCIIGAASYDWNTQNQERDLYILKLDSGGIVTGINNQSPVQSHEVIVYPNPGDDLLYVETQMKYAVFHLYDLSGREVLSNRLIPGRNSLQVRYLNSGLYIYKVAQDLLVKEYGKWIKN